MKVMVNARFSPGLPSEFFGMEQRVSEVGAEQNGDDQSNDRFRHATHLKAPTGAGVGADDHEKQETEAKIQNIKHVRPLCAYQRRSPFRARQARNS
jgi:hypothetical protein